MLTHIIFVFIVIVASILAAFFNVHIVGFIFIILVVVIAYLYVKLSPIFFSKDIHVIETYLKNNKKDPLSQFYYALANDDVIEMDKGIEILLEKYKHPQRRALFLTIQALYRKDIERAKQEVQQLPQSIYKQYYEASIALEEGNLSLARTIGQQIKKQWMQDAIEAEACRHEGQLEQAKRFAKTALAKTRGLQYYSLHKTFKKETLIP
ncbi:hypothetical protein [Alkalihalobacterium bogoriense]|uniref:hypothetical protein n=1 Tax=Alkalihalobacterium bogoriense TaxID=246272 RepID=UPI00047C8397|nr:hypothetical protein [Alkalihalobacterium bogoriense]